MNVDWKTTKPDGGVERPGEVERLHASHGELLAAAKKFANEQTMEHLADLNLAIAKAEELAL